MGITAKSLKVTGKANHLPIIRQIAQYIAPERRHAVVGRCKVCQAVRLVDNDHKCGRCGGPEDVGDVGHNKQLNTIGDMG